MTVLLVAVSSLPQHPTRIWVWGLGSSMTQIIFFSWLCHLVPMVENISFLQEFWNWSHLNWVNVLLFLMVAENHHLLIFEQTIIENLRHVSNDINSYVFSNSAEAMAMCCSNQFSGESVARDLVSCSTSELASASILPSLTLPGLLSAINCLWKR